MTPAPEPCPRGYRSRATTGGVGKYGGLEIDQAKRMKDLERENVRLRRLVADLSLEKQVLKVVR
jgi:hypothetical protein